MRQDKIRNAELLFDAIGSIDDRIIADAQTPYRVGASNRKSFRAMVALTASFAVLTVGVLGATLIGHRAKSEASDAQDDWRDTENAQSTTVNSPLAQTLLSATNRADVVKLDEAELDFFSGKTQLIWRAEGESKVCVLSLTSQTQITKLRQQIGNASHELSPEAAATVGCQVWVSYGNGTVVSPYLKQSVGNVGYGELFAYSPEIEPSEKLVSLIDGLVDDGTNHS